MESDKSPNVPFSSAALTLAFLSRSILTMSLLPHLEARIKAVLPVLANDNRTTDNKTKKANVRWNTQQYDNKDTVPTTQSHSTTLGRCLIQKITHSKQQMVENNRIYKGKFKENSSWYCAGGGVERGTENGIRMNVFKSALDENFGLVCMRGVIKGAIGGLNHVLGSFVVFLPSKKGEIGRAHVWTPVTL